MPAVEIADLNQKAVRWPFVRRNGQGGLVVGEPENVWLRWEYTYREITGKDGTPVVIAANVKIADDTPTGSLLWLAPDQTADGDEALEQFYDTGSAGDSVGLMKVETRRVVPDLKGTETTYMLGLTYFRSTLPTVES